MKENFEIEKELKFKTNIAEVTSISLEESHEYEDNLLKGNFVVSGEYKIHEISLNKEKFNFKLPFEHKLTNDIDEKTIDIEITNFIYDTDNDSLYVTINYDISGDRKDILLFDDEEDLEEFLKSREVEIIMDDTIKEVDDALETIEDKEENTTEIIKELEEIIEESEEIKEPEETIEDKEDIREIQNENKHPEFNESQQEEKRNIEESKEHLLNSVNVNDDNYITYQIHIVKETDTLESILTKYNMTLEELKEYNDFNALQLGDKLIIPITNEE